QPDPPPAGWRGSPRSHHQRPPGRTPHRPPPAPVHTSARDPFAHARAVAPPEGREPPPDSDPPTAMPPRRAPPSAPSPRHRRIHGVNVSRTLSRRATPGATLPSPASSSPECARSWLRSGQELQDAGPDLSLDVDELRTRHRAIADLEQDWLRRIHSQRKQ